MLEKIKADTLRMRKAKDPLAAKMVTLQSAITMIAKNDGNRESTDEDAARAVRQFLKGAEETRQYRISTQMPVEDLDDEIAMYRSYLPAEMSEGGTREAVKKAILEVGTESIKDMGLVMANLKKTYGTAINMKTAGAIVKQLLT